MRPGRVLQITGQGEACFHTDLSAPLASTLSHERITLDYLCTAFAGIAGYSFFQAGRRGLAMRGLGCSPCYWATLAGQSGSGLVGGKSSVGGVACQGS